jgi:hypothetical protein
MAQTGSDCYEHMLLHTNDALVVSEDAKQVPWNKLGRHFTSKEELIGPPKMCLGGHYQKAQLNNNGIECWAFSSSQHVEAAFKNVEDRLSKKRDDVNWNRPMKAETPLPMLHCPALDVSLELQAADAACCMSLIGMLRWIVKLGHVDLCLECSMLPSHLALPTRE